MGICSSRINRLQRKRALRRQIIELRNSQHLLLSTWSALQHNLLSVGVLTFVGMFKAHPHLLVTFLLEPTAKVEDLMSNIRLQNHALHVMDTLNKIIYRLNDAQNLNILWSILGPRHYSWGVQVEHMTLITEPFISAIKTILLKENQWNGQVEHAWRQLFAYITLSIQHFMTERVHRDGTSADKFSSSRPSLSAKPHD